MLKGAKLSQDLSATQSYFESSIWILSVMQTASYKYNREKKKREKAVILTLMQVCFLLHGYKCFVTNERDLHFFRLTHSTKFQRVNTPLTSK